MPLTEIELSYLAGIIDGEGCCIIRKIGNVLQARITITNTNKDLIDWLDSKLGGCWWGEQRGNHKFIYTWEMSGKLIKDILPKLFPYFIIKKEPVKILLEFLKTVTHNPCKHGLSDEVKQKRQNLKEQLLKTR